MNEQTRAEFEQLKRKQSQLERELSSLATRLKQFEAQLATPVPPQPLAVESPAPEPSPAATPPPIPPVISQVPPIQKAPVMSRAAKLFPEPTPETPLPAAPVQSQKFSPPPPEQRAMPQPVVSEKRSLEMRLGTYWLVRLGIIMLLTGLVFFGNYAYQNFIERLGPPGKISLLYLASGLLLSAGVWWQRKAARESLKNYGQVLFAGGLAAVYFTTYAAHHVPHLRVIENALLDGALLLVWAGFMVWTADRKKSEVLALFAIGLAYYTSVITRVGSFTLYSNLVLTLAAVFFLVRNRWAALSFASLVATYASYGFWRFFDGSGWRWASPADGLWFGAYFLVSYWVVFTAAVFLSKQTSFAGSRRAGFLTFNNVAFFTLFLLTMLEARQGGFWKFALIYGAVLLTLTELARRALPGETIAKNSYLTQGLLLVTVGIISKFAGLQLALLLAAESVVLLTLGQAQKNFILQIGAYFSGALAVGFGIDGLIHNDPRTLCLNAAVGGMLAFNAYWSHRPLRENYTLVRPEPAYFTLLALISWCATTWYNTSSANFPLVLALEAGVLTLSIYVLRVREITLFGQSFLLLAQAAGLLHFLEPTWTPPWWNPALLIGITLGLSHWWQRQKAITDRSQLGAFWQGLYALAIIGILYVWLHPLIGAPVWLVVTSALALGITTYGVATRAWWLASAGQIFLAISAGQFAAQLWEKKPEWYFALAPIAVIAVLSFATVNWFHGKPDANGRVREPLLQIALFYRWFGLLMTLWWVQEYIPGRERTWALALLGWLIFLGAGWRRNLEALLFSAVFTVAGLSRFWLPLHGATTIYWPNLLAILALLAQQRLAKRWPDRYQLDPKIHGAAIIIGGLSIWLLLTRWVSQNAGGFYLTASWSALALVLFTFGIAVRERIYRWLGLGLLACALGRVFLFDVWKLETLYRFLSFTALGIVLLVLGFIYNKYQDKLREWL